VFLAISGDFASLRLRDRLRVLACKGVFITLRVTKASTLAPLTSRLPQITGRRTQENGGESTESQSLAPENFFIEGLGI